MNFENKIIDFLLGNLTEEETKLFTQELEYNSQLKEEVKLQQELLHVINQGDDETIKFRKQLDVLGEELLNNKVANRKKLRITPGFLYWGVAASVAVVFSVYMMIASLNSAAVGSDQLYAMNYQTFEQAVVTRGNSGVEEQFSLLVVEFNKGNYSSVLNGFNDLKELKPEASAFYSGLCLMELGRFNEAYDDFLFAEKDAIFYMDHIQWYKALALLKMKKKAEAEIVFNSILESRSLYKDKVEDILQELN